jgi:tetratricopeptide (TPR) repeat protein
VPTGSNFESGLHQYRRLPRSDQLAGTEAQRARLDEAEFALIEALRADGTFAYARSNYGYVLMAKGEFAKAHGVFEQIANDERLKVESIRDVILAKIAIGHLVEEESGHDSTNAAIQKYAEALRDLQLFDYAEVTPDRLRLAYIHETLGEKVYLDKSYYGLEMFALAMFTRANLEARQILAQYPNDVRAIQLLQESKDRADKTSVVVDPAWFRTARGVGVFSTLSKYFETPQTNAVASEATLGRQRRR